MLFKSVLFATFLILAAGRPQDPPAGQNAPAGQQAPPGPAPGGQDPSHDHSADHQPPASIVKNEFVDSGDGSFKWDFETSDGTKAEQTGHTVNPMEGEIIQGSYSYKSPDGKTIQVTYIADKNGFQPMGDHLPTPPADPNRASSNSTAAVAPPATNLAGAAAPGAPAGSPAGPPAGSPAGPPAGSPAGPPAGSPAGVPQQS